MEWNIISYIFFFFKLKGVNEQSPMQGAFLQGSECAKACAGSMQGLVQGHACMAGAHPRAHSHSCVHPRVRPLQPPFSNNILEMF